MRTATLILSLILASHVCPQTSDAASDSTSTGKAGSNQGLTLEEIGRGLKSAARNIEEEIPKIGPAIGKTFKQVTGGETQANKSKEPPQKSTRSKK
jgi:hypothetical protein